MQTQTKAKPYCLLRDGARPLYPEIDAKTKIEHKTIVIDEVEVTKLQAAIASIRGGWDRVTAGRYIRLTVDGLLYMSDTEMERYSNYDFVCAATGDVFIAGLGLGMIAHAILQKPDVKKVVIVENNADLIEVVAPRLADPRLTIVHADALEWKPAKGEKFDTIYFDIWPDYGEGNLPEIRKMRLNFRGRRNPGCWVQAWMEDEIKRRR
jgi:hypothetical protein